MGENCMPINDAAQVAYMEAIRKQAIEKIEKLSLAQRQSLPIDPQGRVLIDVNFDKSNFPAITTISNTTTVSVDIGSSNLLKEAFEFKLSSEEPNVETEAVKNYLTQPRGSVIPLQQEMHFHMAAVNRVLTEKLFKEDFSGKKADISEAFQQATSEVNQLVTKAFKEALKKATRGNNTIDVAKLNEGLDIARKDIAPKAHKILVSAVAKHTGVELRNKDIDPKQVKHHAEATAATANDILFLDSQLNSATLIKGNEQTAHNRVSTSEPKGLSQVDPSFAHRQIITQTLSEKGIKQRSRPRIQIRTPSPVVKDLEVLTEVKNEQNKAAIKDVSHKLQEVVNNYYLNDKLDHPKAHASIPKAFIYNRHTAFNDRIDEIQGKNKQTQSAKHILAGAHAHNKANLNDGVMCFVQNISVNGFGKTLGDGYFSNALQKETTLMAEMAMLHSNYDQLTEPQQDQFRSVITQYNNFLRKNNDPPKSFSQSEEGKNAKAEINGIKASIKQNGLSNIPKDDVAALAKQSLLKMMADNQHFSHDNAKTIQALSVFVEEASISGCKSGNERAEAINKRVAVIDALEAGSNKPEIEAVKEALQACATNPSEVSMKVLNKTLDAATNNLALQSAPTAVSHTDQHAGAKVEPKLPYTYNPFKNVVIFFQNMNRNLAESSDMNNLQQSKASKMQAHKNFSTYIKSAIQPDQDVTSEIRRDKNAYINKTNANINATLEKKLESMRESTPVSTLEIETPHAQQGHSIEAPESPKSVTDLVHRETLLKDSFAVKSEELGLKSSTTNKEPIDDPTEVNTSSLSM